MFVRNCDVYIFDEPPAASTLARSRDLPPHAGACRRERIIRFFRADRVMNMSDRIAVVWNGRIVGSSRRRGTDEQ